MEYDNHLNSYSHAHNQRLKQLKQYEAGRRFGGRGKLATHVFVDSTVLL